MSLMKLLSAGKCWVGLKDSASQYRMGKPGMLPKFGSERNPFGAKKTAGEAGGPERPPELDRSAEPESSDRSNKAGTAAAPRNWAAKLGSLVGLRVKKPEPKSSAPAARPQLELSLDNIRVVRNDLSDADIEIVATQSPALEGSRKTGSGTGSRKPEPEPRPARPAEVASAMST